MCVAMFTWRSDLGAAAVQAARIDARVPRRLILVAQVELGSMTSVAPDAVTRPLDAPLAPNLIAP
jgi:hypothetical protein